jgi:flagellar hook assembly protein FlgD
VDLMTGDTTRIGRTGLNTTTNSIAFDEMGNLFGVVGSGSLTSDFISISTIDGSANMIGSTGIQGLTGISFGETGVSDVQTNTTELIPSDFNLKQNYPNPFNPSTKIEFAIPVQSDVQLTIYNLLGQKISTLFDGQLQAGNHSFTWNADDISGKKLSSGIYFYELKAEGSNGNNFQNTKKMLLLK